MIEHDSETAHHVIAAAGGKVTALGAAGGVVGWATADVLVGVISVALAFVGLLVTVVFRWLDYRAKCVRRDAEEARAQERHALQVAVYNAQLSGARPRPAPGLHGIDAHGGEL